MGGVGYIRPIKYHMKKTILPYILSILLFGTIANAQSYPSWTSADMYLAIRKLNVIGTALYVAAHPDDENTRLITYLSKDRLVRTGYISMTRGDGGQNLIGNEQGVELGMIRTQELLAARRVDGGEQFFTRAYDFGYSKTAEETFNKWDKEKILSDVVWVIRKFQPDIVITRFPTTGEGGHGHHTASGILANDAFEAAADPARFPEQLKYVTVWQVKRVMWNSFGGAASGSGILRVDVGGYSPLLGKSYGEIAALSRSNHKSQGFGAAASRGESFENFTTTKGSSPTTDLFDGVELTWNRVKGGQKISEKINTIASTFDLLHPDKSVKQLVSLFQDMKVLPESNWKIQKIKEVNELIQQCSGLFLDATVNDQFAVQTDSIRVTIAVNNRLGTDATLQKVVLDEYDSLLAKKLEKNRNIFLPVTLFVSTTKPITQPYWLASKMSEGYFNVSDQQKIGNPDVDPSYKVSMEIDIYNERFTFQRPVRYKFTHPVHGELYQPVVVLPQVLISPDEQYKITKDDNKFDGTLYLTGKKKGFVAEFKGVGKENPGPVEVKYEPSIVTIEEKNRIIPVKYKIESNIDNDYYFAVPAQNGRNDVLFLGLSEVKYDHIPNISYFKNASVVNRKLDLETYGKKIGYITGAGDKVPEGLEEMGYDVSILSEKELSRNNLEQYDAILTGVRAYNTNEWMNKYYDKLMKYVEEGGNLIVQYNTSSNIGPVKAKISPFTFDISRTRITDENSPISFLKPEHSVFNFPNKITTDDFKGWVQERSIYHASGWDASKFEAVLGMTDPGEKEESGSLIIGRYGKGYFTYTGLVFFRQLPAGVAGAYRLLANIIALNKKKGF